MDPSGVWRHSSGVLLPRGAVVTRTMDPDELAAFNDRCSAQAEPQAACAGRVRRSVASASQLDAFCEWLQANGLDIFGTVTYRDEYANRYGVYSLKRGLDDVWAGLTHLGFRYKFVLAGEWHPSGRQVPHVHLALESAGQPIDKMCSDLYRYFFDSRGRSRFEPMRDQNVATLYALKDSVKASARDADSMRFRLWRPKRVRS